MSSKTRGKKGILISNVCKCGCNTTFYTLPSLRREFLNWTHYVNWKKSNPRNNPSYIHGLSHDYDYLRKIDRRAKRKKYGTLQRFPDLTDDDLVFVKRRIREPTEVTEFNFSEKIDKQCPVCKGTFKVLPHEDGQTTCSNRCRVQYLKQHNTS